MAEGLAHYGFYPNSAHSQDFILECDQNQNPTGRVYVRDIMDSHGDKMILEARGGQEVLEVYESAVKVRPRSGLVEMTAIPFNGMENFGLPTWLDTYEIFEGFSKEFRRIYGQLTGVRGLSEKMVGLSGISLQKFVKEDAGFLKWIETLKAKSPETSEKCSTNVSEISH